jgi:hypothetical protein
MFSLRLCKVKYGPLLTCFLCQIRPLQSPLKWRSVVTFSSPAAKNFTFRVVGGQTLELVIAQFWSSGIGSHETANVDLKVKVIHVVVNLLSPSIFGYVTLISIINNFW